MSKRIKGIYILAYIISLGILFMNLYNYSTASEKITSGSKQVKNLSSEISSNEKWLESMKHNHPLLQPGQTKELLADTAGISEVKNIEIVNTELLKKNTHNILGMTIRLKSISFEELTRILYDIEKTPGKVDGFRKYQNFKISSLKIIDSGELFDVNIIILQNLVV